MLRSAAAIALVLSCFLSARAPEHATQDSTSAWPLFFEEARMQAMQARLTKTLQPKTVAFVGVDVIPMNQPGVLPDRTVIVRDGRIQAIGPRASLEIPGDALRVDGKGRYLMPGLTDMHVHTLEHSAHMLLNLANGVTSVREMCGFQWLLAQREQVKRNRLLAPNMYVAGPLLNYYPMEFYAVAVTTPSAAREAVLAQHKAGYDFIKVHNVLPQPIYREILSTARDAHIRVVGHIPHDITVAEAVAAGQRTFEHFKGYFLDGTLELTTEDYVASTKGADVWNCPTFYTRRNGYTKSEIQALAATEEMRYVSPRDLRRWRSAADGEGSAGPRKIFEMSKAIFAKLLPTGARFLAGTDSGSYANMVPGFALIEELTIMESLGMPSYDVLRAATVNAAEAMERTAEFGTIEVGKRADLLLLDRNPLEGVVNVRTPAGVMVRGIWLDRTALDSMLEEIASIYRTAGEDASLDEPSEAQVTELLAAMTELDKNGLVFKDHQLDLLADLLRRRDRKTDAESVLRWKRARRDSPSKPGK